MIGTWRDKLIYYWRYPRASRKFPEIRGMTHKRYLETYVKGRR